MGNGAVDKDGNPIQGDQQGGGDLNAGKTVPLADHQALRGEVETLKGQLQQTQEQLRIYQANPPTGQQGQGKKEQFQQSDVLSGMEEDDVITVADARKLIASIETRLGVVLGEMQFSTQKGDYQEMITKHLPNVIKANPALAQAIATSANPAVVAYELAKTDPEYQKKAVTDAAEREVEQAKKNAGKPGSASQAAGGGGGLSAVDMYAQMSDVDLEKKIADVKKRG